MRACVHVCVISAELRPELCRYPTVCVCVCMRAHAHRYEEALQFYEEALEDQPSCAVLWKRKVAVYKAMGDTPQAVAELNRLLKV